MYLVDTNVLSAGAPGRQERSSPLVAWMSAHPDSLFLSVVTVAEICDGIARMRRTGDASRAASLEDWLDLVLHLYAERVLPFDIAAARVTGELRDRARADGHSPGFADIAIAATAVSRNLTVLTRNLRHLGPLQISTHNPFDSLPAPHGPRLRTGTPHRLPPVSGVAFQGPVRGFAVVR